MKWKPKLLSSLVLLAIFDANAGIMREDVAVQDYRDFAENLGKYSAGEENIEVFKMMVRQRAFLTSLCLILAQ